MDDLLWHRQLQQAIIRTERVCITTAGGHLTAGCTIRWCHRATPHTAHHTADYT